MSNQNRNNYNYISMKLLLHSIIILEEVEMEITTKAWGKFCGLFITIGRKHFNLYWNSNHEVWFNNHKLFG